MARRYAQLEVMVRAFRPRSMVEVGTWNGKRAVRLARVALAQVPRFHYRGYDLFEAASRETDERELNVKHHASRDAVRERLEAFRAAHPGFSFELFAGDTRETLADQRADLAYIDGGHSVDTIRGDYERLRSCPVVVFDDYYEPDGQGACPDLRHYGCNAVVRELPHRLLPLCDPIAGGGLTRQVLVGPPLPLAARLRLEGLRLRARAQDWLQRRLPPGQPGAAGA